MAHSRCSINTSLNEWVTKCQPSFSAIAWIDLDAAAWSQQSKDNVVQSLPLLNLSRTTIKHCKMPTQQKLIPAWSIYSKCFWNLPQLWYQNLKVPITGKTIPITNRRIRRRNVQLGWHMNSLV